MNQVKDYSDINLGVLKNIPNKSTVLDLGCGTGFQGGNLRKEKNCTVFGVDSNPDILRIAAKNMDRVFLANLEEPTFKLPIKNFDILLMAGILEHLRNPDQVLKNIVKQLKPGCCMVITLPNIACWEMRLRLLLGNFTYTPTGLLDHTHLRFFTLKTGKQLINATGLKIKKIDVTPHFTRAFLPLFRRFYGSPDGTSANNSNSLILQSPLFKIYRKYIYPIETIVAGIRKQLFSLEFIFVVEKK
ncbi:methyltransferase domain-containing protein [Candidatus Woesearchaeota archaeon]|nr:methyltransferase domain-containing protein [Candidatus Woesearchaeota archaeon]